MCDFYFIFEGVLNKRFLLVFLGGGVGSLGGVEGGKGEGLGEVRYLILSYSGEEY